MERLRRHIKRVLVGIAGGLIIIVGIIMIPYPGPGWLTVFAGLAVLSTEFAFATKLLAHGRVRYRHWVRWQAEQPWIVRLALLSMTGLIVVVSIWLVNGIGIGAALFHVDAPWLTSPFFR
jgi:uncharacterized protein (TIGR02611 family)